METRVRDWDQTLPCLVVHAGNPYRNKPSKGKSAGRVMSGLGDWEKGTDHLPFAPFWRGRDKRGDAKESKVLLS